MDEVFSSKGNGCLEHAIYSVGGPRARDVTSDLDSVNCGQSDAH